MKRVLSVAMVAVALSLVSFAQSSMTPAMQNAPQRKSPLADYAGGWIASFEGHTWMTMRLALEANQITGSVQRQNDLKFSDNGELKSVGEEQTTAPIENAQLNGDGLLLTVKNAETQETTRYMMRLTTANTAEVKIVAMSMPPGMPKPKPFTLMRVGPTAVAPVR